MLDGLERPGIRVFFVDGRGAFAYLMPPGLLVQAKRQTSEVERNNFMQRHRFGRFRRKTRIVSRSIHMVGLAMPLFACFQIIGVPELTPSFFRVMLSFFAATYDRLY